MTLNMWGFSGNRERRCQLIAKLLRHEQPDIVGLQEVCHFRASGLIGESQAVALARMANYPFWHFVPAHRSQTKTIDQTILSQHLITAVDILPFPRDPIDPKDTEDRVAVWAWVALGRGIEFCVTHLSLSRKARERSVRQLANWLWQISDAPKILAGDLNDEPNSPPLQFLLREVNPLLPMHGKSSMAQKVGSLSRATRQSTELTMCSFHHLTLLMLRKFEQLVMCLIHAGFIRLLSRLSGSFETQKLRPCGLRKVLNFEQATKGWLEWKRD